MEETIKVIQCLIDNTKQSIIENNELSVESTINREIGYKALETLLQAYKEDERVIEEMIEHIDNHCFYSDDYVNSCDVIEDSCYKNIDCKNCIKQYFRNKVREENNR